MPLSDGKCHKQVYSRLASGTHAKTVLRTCRRWKFLNHQKHKQIADFFVLENIVTFQKRAVVKNDKNLVI